MASRKVVLISGASQGIGAGLVQGYRRLGYAVVANSRTIAASDDPDVLTGAGDIADPRVAEAVVDAALESFGRVDSLVNNAGLGINLGGFFHLTQKAVTQMSAQGFGHVVNVTTTLVEHALANVPAALASLTKGGTAAVTKSLAIEYASRGIRLNAVSPGIIQTPLHAAQTHERYAALHPVGRMGTIDDVVHGVLYLEQAPFVTGEFLHVDGGQSAGH